MIATTWAPWFDSSLCVCLLIIINSQPDSGMIGGRVDFQLVVCTLEEHIYSARVSDWSIKNASEDQRLYCNWRWSMLIDMLILQPYSFAVQVPWGSPVNASVPRTSRPYVRLHQDRRLPNSRFSPLIAFDISISNYFVVTRPTYSLQVDPRLYALPTILFTLLLVVIFFEAHHISLDKRAGRVNNRNAGEIIFEISLVIPWIL